MKKVLLFVLVIIICVSTCACGGGDNVLEQDTTISSSSDAIYAVKTDINTNHRIANGLGYVFHKDPEYGICRASKNSDGTWEVTLKGKMWGYYNETKTDLDICGFVLTATVSQDGEILSAQAEKAD